MSWLVLWIFITPLFSPWHQVHELSDFPWEVLMVIHHPREEKIKERGMERPQAVVTWEILKYDPFWFSTQELLLESPQKPTEQKGMAFAMALVKSYLSGKMLILVGIWPSCPGMLHVINRDGTLVVKHTCPRLIRFQSISLNQDEYSPE